MGYLRIAAAMALVLLSSGAARAADGPIFGAYTGSQQGVTERDGSLTQQLSFDSGVNASGIAVTSTGHVFLSSRNHIYDYTTAGVRVADMTYPDTALRYTAITTRGGWVFSAYAGSQRGVTIRDPDLVQSSYIETPFEATGIAAGDQGHLYLTSGNHIYDYLIDGTLVTDMAFSDAGIRYSAVTYANNTVYAGYNAPNKA